MVKTHTTSDDINVVARLRPLRLKSFAPTQECGVILRSTRSHWAVGRGEVVDEALPVWIHADNDITGALYASASSAFIHANFVILGCIHAFITLDSNDQFWIKDNMSKNGTTVSVPSVYMT